MTGAYGFTGSIISNKLNSASIGFSIAGRDPLKLEHLQHTLGLRSFHLLDTTDPSQVETVLKDFDVVINCVGPYSILSKPIIEYAARNSKIYVDLTGEQDVVLHSFQELLQPALASGSTLVHSFAFESAPADLLAHEIISPGKTYSEISSFYYYGKGRPSPGTRLTMKLAAHYPSYYLSQGELVNEPPLGHFINVCFPGSPEFSSGLFMPYPEILFFRKKFKPLNSGSYLLADDDTRQLALASSKRAPKPVEQLLSDHSRTSPTGPTDEERSGQSFIILVYSRTTGNEIRCVKLSGHNMYAVTGDLIVLLMEHLENHSIPAGVVSPAEVAGGPVFLQKVIKRSHLRIDYDEVFEIVY
ncbi:MAG: saccharopine dehydrogenase NADP-binding domain-containing protein [Bacteroidetes bacterium]|nr:saccharopine dehydrogenase NADP-binding domain-containing protein [Bacteroidota bacterium]